MMRVQIDKIDQYKKIQIHISRFGFFHFELLDSVIQNYYSEASAWI